MPRAISDTLICMKWLRRYWTVLVLVVLLSLNGLALWQHQWIGDWWRLRNYEPPKAIAAIADAAGMGDRGRHLFYVNHPTLESKDGFNKHCEDHDLETAVLGCYHGNRKGIYLYAVTDERLHGVQEVTAAHEMLHQAYDRLNNGERARIVRLMDAYYASGTVPESVSKKIESYKKQPGVVLSNEMHSIFGSEVRALPPELETYYQQYFSDRSKVVALSEAYQAEFTRRQELVEQYDSQLEDLKNQIDANKDTLSRKLSSLKQIEQNINAAAAQGDTERYRSDIAAYNAQVGEYNALVNRTRTLIKDYNAIVAQRNEIATEEQELQQALDSQFSPEPTQ